MELPANHVNTVKVLKAQTKNKNSFISQSYAPNQPDEEINDREEILENELMNSSGGGGGGGVSFKGAPVIQVVIPANKI